MYTLKFANRCRALNCFAKRAAVACRTIHAATAAAAVALKRFNIQRLPLVCFAILLLMLLMVIVII